MLVLPWILIAGPLAAGPVDGPGARCGTTLQHTSGIDGPASVSRGAECDTFILATDAADSVPFSWGQAEWPDPVGESFEVRVRFRRLSGDVARSFEIHVPGGALLLRDGGWAYFESNPQFATDGGYRSMPELRGEAEHEVRLVQRDGVARSWVDGVELDPMTWTASPRGGPVVFAAKGEPGIRSRVLLRDVLVRALGPEAQVSSQ